MKTKINYPKTLIILILTMAFSITACEKEKVEIPVDDIIGTWTATDVSVDITFNNLSAYDYWISQGATPEEATYQVGYQTRGFGTYIPITIEFLSDGTLTGISGAIGDEAGSPFNGTWELSNDRKVLTLDGLEGSVIALNKTDLSFQLVFDSDEYSQELMTYEMILIYIK